jgi:ribosome-binding factor A
MAREFSRTDRVSQHIHKEVASILQNEYKHKVGDLPLTTVSGVEVSRDLAHAKVFVTFYNQDDEETKQQLAMLNDHKGFVRTLLAKRVRMRAVPAIHFHADGSLSEGVRISTLVSQTIAEDNKKRSQ